MEDFVTWVDTSKLKRTIMKYNDEVSKPSYLSSPDALSANLVPLLVAALVSSWTISIYCRPHATVYIASRCPLFPPFDAYLYHYYLLPQYTQSFSIILGFGSISYAWMLSE